MELIDRAEVTNKLISLQKSIQKRPDMYESNDEVLGVINYVHHLISQLPTIESRPRGEWIKSLTFQAYSKCSVCGCLSMFKTKFCSECGADMREKV